MVNLTGRVVFVTGASRGIGEALARTLAADGAAVVLAARGVEPCEALAGEIETAGGKALAVACDVSDPASVAAAKAAANARFGTVDSLVNNAGVVQPIGRITDCAPDAWRTNLDINLAGAFNVVHAFLPDMIKNGGGTILNVSSGAAHNALEGWSAYCAAKAGLAMFTRSIDLEYRDQGVRVFGFGPGTVDTEMQVQIRASGINPVSQLPRGNLAPPQRPAQVMAWLLGGESDDLSGQELSIRDDALLRRAGVETD
jgi:NAD(P)-dependent dehydrogenase (short-subunit alcohol dehydrogenase family)